VETTVVHPVATGNLLTVRISPSGISQPCNAYLQYSPFEAQLRRATPAACVQTACMRHVHVDRDVPTYSGLVVQAARPSAIQAVSYRRRD